MNNDYNKKLDKQELFLIIRCSNNVVNTINKNNPNWEEVYNKVKTLMDVTYTLSPYNNSFNASSQRIEGWSITGPAFYLHG